MKKKLYNLPNKIIAVTGGIASGKTYKCRQLEAEGKHVFYADKIVKKIYKKQTFYDFLWALQQEFFEYEDVIEYTEDSNYEINFKTLRERAFESPMVLNSLEEFVNDHFEGEFLKEYMERGLGIPEIDYDLGRSGTEYPRLEYSIIYFEYAPERLVDINLFDEVIRIEAPTHVRIERIIKRDGCSRELAIEMIKRQES